MAAGFVAGTINVVAGGGSFLTLPLLIFLGLPPHVANGTNRLAILIQTAGAATAFRRADRLPMRILSRIGVAAAVGAAIGSTLAMATGEAAFQRALAVVMVLFTLAPVLGRRARRANPDTAAPEPGSAGLGLCLAFVGVGFYGGFIQAGVGFLSLGATSWAGYDLVRGNAIKVACIFLFSVVSLAVFSAHGVVSWTTGLALGTGTLLGALYGTRLTLRAGERRLRAAVAICTVVFAVALWFRS